MFVIVFPQLTLVLYWETANTYGSVTSFVISLLLRLLCGDKSMGIPPTISFGYLYNPADGDGSAVYSYSYPKQFVNNPADDIGTMPFRLFVTIIGTVSHYS